MLLSGMLEYTKKVSTIQIDAPSVDVYLLKCNEHAMIYSA